MPEQVDQCARSILDDNPGMDKDTAYAICQDMDNRGVLTDYMDAAPETAMTAALAKFQNPGQIVAVDKDGGRLYKNVMLLAPGVWTDAGSRQTIHYSGKGIRASADNWIDPVAWRTNREKVPVETGEVNLLHGPALHGADTLDDIGEIPLDSITVDDQDRLFGDIFLHGDTAQSETAIELMDEALAAANDPDRKAPALGPSVEIADDVVERNDEQGLLEMTEAWFTGIGLVFGPASEPVELENQVRERAVAMADALGVPEGGLVYRLEETLNTESGHLLGMTETEREQFMDDYRALKEEVAELKYALQEDEVTEALFDAIAAYQQAGNELGNPVSEFVTWMEENTDLSQSDVQGVLDAYLESQDADSLDVTPVEGLMSWLDAQDAGNEEPEGDGDEEEPSEPTMEDLREAANTISSFKSELEDVKDLLQKHQSDREELFEDLERRLSKVEGEEQPQARVMSKGGDDFIDFQGEDLRGDGEHEDVTL